MALQAHGSLLRDQSWPAAKRLTSTCPSLPIRSRLERSCKARGTFGEQRTGRELLLAAPSLQPQVRIRPAVTSWHWADLPASTLPGIWEARFMGLIGARHQAGAPFPRSPEQQATATWFGRRLTVDAFSSRPTLTIRLRPT